MTFNRSYYHNHLEVCVIDGLLNGGDVLAVGEEVGLVVPPPVPIDPGGVCIHPLNLSILDLDWLVHTKKVMEKTVTSLSRLLRVIVFLCASSIKGDRPVQKSQFILSQSHNNIYVLTSFLYTFTDPDRGDVVGDGGVGGEHHDIQQGEGGPHQAHRE